MIQTIHELNIAPQAQGDTHNVRKEIQFEEIHGSDFLSPDEED